MIHAAAYVLFILPFTAWLGYELKRSYSLRTHWRWIVGAVLIGVVGSLNYNAHPTLWGNLLLHASGGASSVLLFVYLTRTLKLHFNWRLTALLLFAFVCMLGVMNELAEYFFEMLGFGVFSVDSHDTWRDFVANTIGAAVTWAAYMAYQSIKRK